MEKEIEIHLFLDTEKDSQQVDVLVRSMDKGLRAEITEVLKNMGYANHVIIDEINAYMASSKYKYLKEELDLNVTRADMKPFVDLKKTIMRR